MNMSTLNQIKTHEDEEDISNDPTEFLALKSKSYTQVPGS